MMIIKNYTSSRARSDSRQSGSAGTTMISLRGNSKCFALAVLRGILEREWRQ